MEPITTLNLHIKTLDGRTHPISVPRDIPIPVLKTRIAVLLSIPESSQRLIYQGKVLKEDKYLRDYPIQDGHVIHLVQRQTGLPESSAPVPVPSNNVLLLLSQLEPLLDEINEKINKLQSRATSSSSSSFSAPSLTSSSFPSSASLSERISRVISNYSNMMASLHQILKEYSLAFPDKESPSISHSIAADLLRTIGSVGVVVSFLLSIFPSFSSSDATTSAFFSPSPSTFQLGDFTLTVSMSSNLNRHFANSNSLSLNQLTSAVSPPTSTGLNSSASMMSQAFNIVNQAMFSTSMGMKPTINQLIQTFTRNIGGKTDEAPTSNLSLLVRVVLDTLTLPDMLALLSGNWSVLERVHLPLKGKLTEQISLRNISIDTFTASIISELQQTIKDETLPPLLLSRVKLGYVVSDIVIHELTKYIQSLLDLIVSSPSPSTSSPYPFSSSVHVLTDSHIFHSIRLVSQAMVGGVTDATNVIKYYCQQHLSLLPPEFQSMGTNMLTDYLMETYKKLASSSSSLSSSAPSSSSSSFSSSSSSVSEDLSDFDESWRAMLEVDAIREKNVKNEYNTQSAEYLQGSSSKKRKADTSVTVNDVSSLLTNTLTTSIKDVKPRPTETTVDAIREKGEQPTSENVAAIITENIIPKSTEAITPTNSSSSYSATSSSSLVDLYKSQVSEDVVERLEKDTNFQAKSEKYAHASALYDRKRKLDSAAVPVTSSSSSTPSSSSSDVSTSSRSTRSSSRNKR